MIYSLVHLLLLLAATLGVWLARSRLVVLIVGLMLFPLPAALFNYYAVPIPAIATSLAEAGSTDTTVKADDCSREPQPARKGASNLDQEQDRADVSTDCTPRKSSLRKQILAAAIATNYLTVLIGFFAGLLCRAMVSTAPAAVAAPRPANPGRPAEPPRPAAPPRTAEPSAPADPTRPMPPRAPARPEPAPLRDPLRPPPPRGPRQTR